MRNYKKTLRQIGVIQPARSKPRYFKPGVIALRSMSEVAKILCLSKGQIDRAEQSALYKLRKALG